VARARQGMKQRAPPGAQARHRELAQLLATAGVDLLLCETFPTSARRSSRSRRRSLQVSRRGPRSPRVRTRRSSRPRPSRQGRARRRCEAPAACS
jgi:hypothetical protein